VLSYVEATCQPVFRSGTVNAYGTCPNKTRTLPHSTHNPVLYNNFRTPQCSIFRAHLTVNAYTPVYYSVVMRRSPSHNNRADTLLLNPLNAELNPICYLLALLGAHHFFHVSRIRVKSLTLRQLMSYIYGAPILDISRSHTTTQHSR